MYTYIRICITVSKSPYYLSICMYTYLYGLLHVIVVSFFCFAVVNLLRFQAAASLHVDAHV